MCAEREPLDCHRCLLVGRALARRGCTVGHILGDGAIEPHSATEERLLAACGPGPAATCSGTANRASPRPIAGAPAGSPRGCPTGSGPGGPPGVSSAFHVVLSRQS